MRARVVGVTVVLFGLALLLMPVSARGQSGDGLPAVAGATAAPAGDERITLNFPDVPFGTFLKALTEKSNLKLVTSPDIAKKAVSCYLPNVTAKEALDAVCSAFDLCEVPDPSTGVIVIKENDSALFPLEHVGAKEAQTVVPSLIGTLGKVSYDEKNNYISVRGTPRDLRNVRDAMATIDATPRNVRIEATIAELTETASELIGIRWEPNILFRGAVLRNRIPFHSDLMLLDADSAAWSNGFLSFQDFLVQLQFMETDGTVKILATPQVTVLDGKPANFQNTGHIVVGVKVTRQEGTLNLVNEEPIFSDIGVTLTCVPHVHPDNKITLEVTPTVSTAARSQFFPDFVDTFNRQATTIVMADDGETIAIGGLLRDNVTQVIRKVPFIGDIPILGYLFRHKDQITQKTNLVVFLTPHLVDKENMKKEVQSYKDLLTSKVD